MTNTARIKILSPVVRMPEEELEVDMDTRVDQLTNMVTQRLPEPDNIKDIRFLYSGRILKDTDLLSDHLKVPPESQVFTIHMSCSLVNNERSNPESQPYQSEAASSHWSNYGYNFSGISQDNLYNTDVNQIAVFQEVYAQYMLQYMQYINSLQSPPPAADPALDPGVQPQPVPGPGRQEERGQVMNAGGGGMMEDDNANDRGDRDLLDWMYLLSRVVLLFSIVYFYSSITRFLVVAVLAGFVYLYQNGAFGARGRHRIRDSQRRQEERERFREQVRQFRERIRNPDEVNEDNVLDEDGENVEGNNENLDQAVINNQTDDAEETSAQVETPPSLWMVFSNTIYMFFASLFPENIQVN